MTDYFALLQQPRQPWLEPEQLKQKYQQLTLAAHPDRARSDESALDFATITEGYRVLRDPKLRLQHLLKLEGHEVSGGQSVPDEFIEIFSQIGTLVRTSDNLLERSANAQNALSKSLLRAEILDGQRQTQEALTKLERLQEDILEETRSLNKTWTNESATALPKLSDLQQRLAYLARWIDQVRERQFRLSH